MSILLLRTKPGVGGTPTTITIPNFGFELPVNPGGIYNPTGAGWTFGGFSGVAGTGTSFLSIPAPEGLQIGFMQGGGYINQALSGFVPGAHYQLTFKAAQSATQPGSTIAISLDATQIATVSARSSTAFDQVTIGFTASSSTHTLTFQEIAGAGHCTTIDDVHITPVTAFDPTTIPNCILWAEADKLTGFSDGAPVPTWTDFSGTNHHLAQGTVAQQALYKSNILNGKPVLRFDGTNDFYQASITQAQPITVIAVFKPAITAGNTIWDSSASTRMIFQGTGVEEMYAGGFLDSSEAFDTAASHIYMTTYSSTSSGMRRDGISKSSGNAGTQGLNGINLGCNITPGQFAAMDMAAIVMYTRAITNTEANAIGAAWAAKYGLAYQNF